MRKSISPVVAVIIIVAVIALAVGAYILVSKKMDAGSSKGPKMKGANEPNPNALKKGGRGGPGSAQFQRAGAKGNASSAGTSESGDQ